MVLSLKMWQKLLSLFLAVSMAALVGCASNVQKECCLCNSFRYHAPCLIDLETGELIELDLYFPDDKLVAELEDPQPEIDTFSFVKLGNVSGTKMTGNKTIELHIPNDTTAFPLLCKECKKQIPGYTSRYVFADLYDKEAKTLIPINANTKLALRCYEIIMNENKENKYIDVIIQGILQQK